MINNSIASHIKEDLTLSLTKKHYHKIVEFMTNTSSLSTNLSHDIQVQLANLFHLNHSLFWQADPKGNMYNLNFYDLGDAFIKDYTEDFRHQDIMQPHHIQDKLMHQNETVLTIEKSTNTNLHQSTYYQFIKKHQMIDQMVLYFVNGSSIYGGIGFARFKGEAPFNHREKSVLLTISKHLHNVFKTNDAMIEAKSELSYYRQDKDNRLGIIKLNNKRHVLYYNETAYNIITSYQDRLTVEKFYYHYIRPNLIDMQEGKTNSYYIYVDDIEVKIVRSAKEELSIYYILYLYQQDPNKNNIETSLSKREREVYYLVLQGYTNEQISQQLWISINTVKKHLKNMYQKLDVSNRTSFIYKMKRHS